ncbi:Uncharacterized protein OBRU01_23679 [Operophtera brumata]|uniref:MADF domain-containing protein n=1 Tax=Operophtera brumata TaxID=104452 RepID=A0A0L7KNZ2_OPEBR|nr:Uncharacterized protein OBRU01_23679 [Operophtera brumata]
MADASISEHQRISDSAERKFVLLTISLYKEHPELWKAGSPDYSNKFKRQKALQDIASALREFKPYYNEQLLRKKINILRTNFNKEYKKRGQLLASGGGCDWNVTCCWYFDALIFLKDQGESAKEDDDDEAAGLVNPMPQIHREIEPAVKVEEDPEELKMELDLWVASNYNSLKSKHDLFPNLSEYDAVGINVAKKLAKMDPNQAIYAESIINNVLRKGLQKRLRDDTDLCNINGN